MQDTDLLQDGLALMGLGMGVVFVFLTLLVVAVVLMSRLVQRFAPTPAPVNAKRARALNAAEVDEEVLAVIGAAVHHYRGKPRC